MIAEIQTVSQPRRNTTHRSYELPENYSYRDTGCELSPSCLSCPLPQCKYDTQVEQTLQSQDDIKLRNIMIDKEYRSGASIGELAKRHNVTDRTIYRALRQKGGLK